MQRTVQHAISYIMALTALTACNNGSTNNPNSPSYMINAAESSYMQGCTIASSSTNESAVPLSTASPLTYNCSGNSIELHYFNAQITPGGVMDLINNYNALQVNSEENCLFESQTNPVSCAFAVTNYSNTPQTATIYIVGELGTQALFIAHLAPY